MQELYRALPSVDICLKHVSHINVAHKFLRYQIQVFLDKKRDAIRSGHIKNTTELQPERIFAELEIFVQKQSLPRLRKVINATGVVIHTNLGRSVLAKEALDAIILAASGYSNLEFDLDTGERGSRHSLVEELLCLLTGAEKALVVNNNAAAVLLMLDSLCKDGEVIVSRGQLVEIGGSFRIPDVMKKSGTHLHEVGTTNRTHLHDFATAINENTKAFLRVHNSNYRIVGFTSEVSLIEMVKLAHENALPVLDDLGSGSLIDFSRYGLSSEPTVQDTIAAGADVVTFSGDKVLGGPQAGIIVGKAEYINRIKNNQLLRALRCDKMTLAALEATLRLYLDERDALEKIPTVRRMTKNLELLQSEAKTLQKELEKIIPSDLAQFSIKKDNSRVGGGSFPEEDLPTYLVILKPLTISVEDLRTRLLQAKLPLVGRVENEQFLLDPRTIEQEEYSIIGQLLLDAIK